MDQDEIQERWLRDVHNHYHDRYHHDHLCEDCMKVYRDEYTDHIANLRKPVTMDSPRKTMEPPTDAQLARVKELKDRPEFTPHLDWLLDAVQRRNMLNTRGQTGILINEMKKKIREAGGVIE